MTQNIQWISQMAALQHLQQLKTTLITAAGKTLQVYVAVTPEQKTRGLANVTNLHGPQGILFPYTENQTKPYTTANCPLPLHITWWTKNGTLIAARNTDPYEPNPHYSPSPYRYVLEQPVLPEHSEGEMGVDISQISKIRLILPHDIIAYANGDTP